MMHGSQTKSLRMQGSTNGEHLLYTHPLVSVQEAEHANLAASPQANFWMDLYDIIRIMKQR